MVVVLVVIVIAVVVIVLVVAVVVRVRTIPVLGIGRYLRVSVLGDTVFSTRTRYFHSRYRQAPPIVQ